MKNLGAMMKQAQQMQSRMTELQEEIEHFEADGASGGGMISVRMNGKFDIQGISIDPSMIDPDDPDLLADLITAAFNDAKGKIDTFKQEKVQEMTGGLPLPPGFKLPF